MKVLVAAEDSGSIKEVVCSSGTDTSKQDAPQPESIETKLEQGRSCCIDQIVVVDKNLVVARRNGAVEVYDLEYELKYKYDVGSKEAKFVGLVEINDGKSVVACDSKGKITKCYLDESKSESVQFKTEKQLCMFKHSPYSETQFAIGGKELDVEILDVDFEKSNYKSAFKGKNVKNDKLDMPVPIWVVDLIWISENEFITATNYGQLRLYDQTKGRRPQKDVKISEKPITQIQKANENSIIYSDNHMTAAEYSITEWRTLGKLHGATGAVQDMNINSSIVATGGLDRYLRVFNLETRQILAKVFVGTQISSVWILDSEQNKRKQDAELEDDEMWSQLEDKKASKKRKTAA